MPLDALTLRTEDGRHTLFCPVGTVVDVGRDPACEIILDGDGVLPHHCMLRRMGERHFRVTAIPTSARFTVNGVMAADLGVDVRSPSALMARSLSLIWQPLIRMQTLKTLGDPPQNPQTASLQPPPHAPPGVATFCSRAP